MTRVNSAASSAHTNDMTKVDDSMSAIYSEQGSSLTVCIFEALHVGFLYNTPELTAE